MTDLQIAFEKFFQKLEDHSYDIPRDARRDQIAENNFGSRPFMRTLVAETNRRIIGAVSFYPGFLNENPPIKTYHFPYLFVTPEFRGTATIILLNAVKELARTENISRLVFSVYGRNIPAKKLYEHAGAKYWAADADEHFMYFDV